MGESLYILNIWHFLPSFLYSHKDISYSDPESVLIFCYCHTPIARIDLSAMKSISRLRAGTRIAIILSRISRLLGSYSHFVYNATMLQIYLAIAIAIVRSWNRVSTVVTKKNSIIIVNEKISDTLAGNSRNYSL